MRSISSVVFFFSSVATAAANGSESPANWAGFYGGVHISQETASHNVGEDGVWPVYNSSSSSVSRKVSEAGAGVHAGYRFQTGAIVYGLEADISRPGVSDDALGLNQIDTRAILETDSLLTLQASVGMTHGAWLVYGSVGRAKLKAEAGVLDENGVQPSANTMDSRTDLSLSGPVYGLGVAYQMSDGWIAGAQWQRADFGAFTTSGAAGLGGTENWQHSLKMDQLSLKISRQF